MRASWKPVNSDSNSKEHYLVTCPTCGTSVPDDQRFCGNCGTDVHAAMAFRGTAQNSLGGTAAGSATGGGYGYDTANYDYAPSGLQRPTTAMIWLIVAGVAVVCLCCGLVIGGVFSYLFFPTQSAPVPTEVPTPEGLNLLLILLRI